LNTATKQKIAAQMQIQATILQECIEKIELFSTKFEAGDFEGEEALRVMLVVAGGCNAALMGSNQIIVGELRRDREALTGL
jgi:hypothetical protein